MRAPAPCPSSTPCCHWPVACTQGEGRCHTWLGSAGGEGEYGWDKQTWKKRLLDRQAIVGTRSQHFKMQRSLKGAVNTRKQAAKHTCTNVRASWGGATSLRLSVSNTVDATPSHISTTRKPAPTSTSACCVVREWGCPGGE